MEGDFIVVHMWGKCHPTDCDWGEETTSISDAGDGILSLVWVTSFCMRTQELTILPDGRLKVVSFTHYFDDRPDQELTHYFIRSS